MVWTARGSGNHTRPFTSAHACLGAGAKLAVGRPEGRLCVPASPASAGKFEVQATGRHLLLLSR